MLNLADIGIAYMLYYWTSPFQAVSFISPVSVMLWGGDGVMKESEENIYKLLLEL